MNTQNKRLAFGLPVALVVASTLAGCTYLKQTREDVQPVAYESMKQNQTLNPDAGKNRKVVAGLEGKAAVNLSESYTKSFQAAKGGRGASEVFQGISGEAQ